ncbi:MAG: hypothetical protein Q8O67_29490 [Deltaproteobacteria bacterium]|nr:hypothetical protein [Deltaproteobacteria bacterium]
MFNPSTIINVSPRGDDDDDVFVRLAGLSTPARHAFARAVAGRAAELGLAYLGDDGARPIPIALPSAPLPSSTLRRRGEIAHTMLQAVTRVARVVIDGGGEVRAALLEELAPFEREVLAAGPFDPRLATVRADLVVDTADRLRVLEVNTTIPAMQGYSDIAARAFVEVALVHFQGCSAAAAAAQADALLAHKTNADGLLQALLARYREDDGAVALPSIALVHRQGDSQLAELRYLAHCFEQRGHPARTVVVDDVDDDDDDIFYRHVFARRVPAGSVFAAKLRSPRRHHVYNSVAAPLELKGMLALLSEIAADRERADVVGLSAVERAVVNEHLPWTRRLVDAPTTIDGSVAALLPWVRAHRDDVVVKRSQDFGGKSVVLGDAFEGDWAGFVDACAREGGWIVQERVHLASTRLTLATAHEAADHDVYVDASAFASGGVADPPGGCVSRASRSPIVNIQCGGGVLPLIDEELAQHIAA